jgi:hypothetical protein
MTAPQKASVLISVPTHDGRCEVGLAMSLLDATREHKISVQHCRSSLLAYGFNQLWVNAVQSRPGVTHFAMVHADIVPEARWLDKMLRLMREKGADILSAVAPIKDGSGDTSTALDEPLRPRRLPYAEICRRWQATWTDPLLLVNTGLMLVDLSWPGVDKVWFTIADRIDWSSGEPHIGVLPEDWGFSRMARQHGAKIWATREIALTHYGTVGHRNQVREEIPAIDSRAETR